MTRLALSLCLLALAPATALAHGGNPNYLSTVKAVDPAVEGLRVTVLNRDDRLQVQNTTGKDVVVLGYEDEPYARLKADGTVEINKNSQAFYLNEDRLGKSAGPAGLTKDTPPRWEPVSGTGRFEWHDHRMHYMGKGTPPQVSDESKPQKIFDWKVPVEVGGTPATITGVLEWTPQTGGAPVGAIVALAVFVLACIAGVIVVRRRRGRGGDDAPAQETTEAW
jgi:LPXTG-motif cell wall-anchored protein